MSTTTPSQVIHADVLDGLAQLDAGSVQTCVTSPPYWGLRDYGSDGQLGMEPTPGAYVERMVAVFREVRRVLRNDGTVWLNIGDSYAGSWGNFGTREGNQRSRISELWHRPAYENGEKGWRGKPPTANPIPGVKPKDLIGIPWMTAFALRSDGWWLRRDIIWSKPNPMPESVTDRPSSAHEYVFLLSKSQRYLYNADAVKTPMAETSELRLAQDVENQAGSSRANGGAKTNGSMKAVGGTRRTDKQRGHSRKHAGFNDRWDSMSREEQQAMGANLRSVWHIATQPFPEAHFATFPLKLPRTCILAGSNEGDTVLDPFSGSGTTGVAAIQLAREYIGIELNAEYVKMSERRIANAQPGLVGLG